MITYAEDACGHLVRCDDCNRCTVCFSHKPCEGAKGTKSHHDIAEGAQKLLKRVKHCPYCNSGTWKNPYTNRIEQCKNCKGTSVVR